MLGVPCCVQEMGGARAGKQGVCIRGIQKVAGMPLYVRHIRVLFMKHAMHFVTKLNQRMKNLPSNESAGPGYENNLIRHNRAIVCHDRK